MFEITGINGTEIRITRGDSALLQIDLFDDKGAYTLKDGDILELSAVEKLGEPYAIHLYSDRNAIFHIKPSDTKSLDFGVLKYDIQLTLANGEVYTVVAYSDFVITKEVTN